MMFFPRVFSGNFFISSNKYTDIAMIFLGFMMIVFGIIHFGMFYYLTEKTHAEEIQNFKKKGVVLLLNLLLIGDFVHIMRGFMAWRFHDRNILTVPSYYLQFIITFFCMFGRIYALQKIDFIYGKVFKKNL